MTKSETGYLSYGEVAERIGCQVWQVARVFTRKLLPPAKRIGRNHVVEEGRIEEVKAALKGAGFLKSRG